MPENIHGPIEHGPAYMAPLPVSWRNPLPFRRLASLPVKRLPGTFNPCSVWLKRRRVRASIKRFPMGQRIFRNRIGLHPVTFVIDAGQAVDDLTGTGFDTGIHRNQKIKQMCCRWLQPELVGHYLAKSGSEERGSEMHSSQLIVANFPESYLIFHA